MNKHLKLAKNIAELLDNKFSIGGIRFGLDPIIDLVPGIGDIIGVILSCYIVWIGKSMNLPSKEIHKMVFNVVLDFVIGLIPIIGTIFDVAYKANIRNLRILQKYQASSVINGEIIAE